MATMNWEMVTHESNVTVPMLLDPTLLTVTTTGRDDPPQWSATMKKTKLLETIRYYQSERIGLIQERDASRAKANTMTGQINNLTAQLEMMKKHWRPVPLTHEWEPRDYRCSLCDDPRDSTRHKPAQSTVDVRAMSRETLRLAMAALDAAAEDEREPERYRADYAQARADIRRVVSKVDGPYVAGEPLSCGCDPLADHGCR